MVAIESNDPVPAMDEMDSLRESGSVENRAIADRLEEIGTLLAEQQASEFRVRAYRDAAETVRTLASPLRVILQHDGLAGLIAIPTIGQSIARLIDQDLRLGRMPLLDRLRGEVSAEQYFTSLPGIGPQLSQRIHEYFHVETLPELAAVVEQGRLDRVPGIGRKRSRAIRDSLAQRLQHKNAPKTALFPETDRSVSVSEILGIDDQYRRLAGQGKLPKIAPRKFNPGNVAWLPILHTERSGRHYSALYSNTAHAHELNATHDWVVIYRDDADAHARWTVITSQFGTLRGRRIVRGREDECRRHFEINDNVVASSNDSTDDLH